MASKQRCTCLHPRRVIYGTLQKPGFHTAHLCYACYTAARAAPDLLLACQLALNDRMYKEWPEIAERLMAAITKAGAEWGG